VTPEGLHRKMRGTSAASNGEEISSRTPTARDGIATIRSCALKTRLEHVTSRCRRGGSVAGWHRALDGDGVSDGPVRRRGGPSCRTGTSCSCGAL